ncbi:hypothetical protein C8Q75DRAFT_793093 [Abortiporus biennis]|nr:hypothetical protein C8Q75DRAFT_793093 [Abortiporus biennis]
MSTPSTLHTVIPIITTEVEHGPEYTIDQLDHGEGAPVQYRIEERRRTIYVTTNSPSVQLDSQMLNELFKLTDIPEGSHPNEQSRRRSRTRSLEDRLESGARLSPVTSRQSSQRSENIMESPLSRPSTNRKRFSAVPSPVSARTSPATSPTSYSIRKSWTWVKPPPILFYHKHEPHYGFTNFSPHPVVYKGKKYPTSEHLFQSFKFQDHRPNLAEHIRTCSEHPSVAFAEARRFQPEVRRDWMAVNVEKMDKALWYKFTQHQDLKDELLATGDADLVENSDKDAFWGIGADGKGRNELGKALQRLRVKLRNGY